MISVVVPLYNKEKSIGKTLDCVLNQSYQDFEIVIVNDGSSDGSVEAVNKFTDPRIRLINQQNAGVSAARNRGIAEAKGEFVAFLDADDEWDKDYLRTQHQMTVDFHEADVFATNYVFAYASDAIRPTILNKIPFDSQSGILSNYFEVSVCSHPPLWTSAVMVRKSAIEAIGGFPVGIKSGEDLLTWARLACRGKVAFCKIPMAAFLCDPENYDADQKKRFPESIDYVGDELIKLSVDYDLPGLREYVALWFKMRARIFLQKGFNGRAFKECVKSSKYDMNAKILVFMALCCLPTKLVNKIFNKVS